MEPKESNKKDSLNDEPVKGKTTKQMAAEYGWGLFITSVVTLSIIAWLVFYETRQVNNIALSIFILPFVFILFIVIAAAMLVSILNLYTPSSSCDDNSKEGINCKYCGSPCAGSFLCGSCKSITWYKINGKGLLLPTAIFILEHRWAVIAALSGALFIGPVYTLVEKRKEVQRTEEAMRAKNEESLSMILNELSTARSKIVNLEMSSDSTYDMKEWAALNTSYTAIYWNIVPAFERLLENTTKNNPEFAKAIEETKHYNQISLTAFEKKVEGEGLITYGPAYVINHRKFDLSCVDLFIDYINSVHLCERNPSKKNVNARKELARRLFHQFRTTSIMIRCLIDSKWLLTKGRYPSQAADPAFYFKSMFAKDGDFIKHIYDLEFNYEVRSIDAFDTI